MVNVVAKTIQTIPKKIQKTDAAEDREASLEEGGKDDQKEYAEEDAEEDAEEYAGKCAEEGSEEESSLIRRKDGRGSEEASRWPLFRMESSGISSITLRKDGRRW